MVVEIKLLVVAFVVTDAFVLFLIRKGGALRSDVSFLQHLNPF